MYTTRGVLILGAACALASMSSTAAANDCDRSTCSPVRLEAKFTDDVWHVARGGLAQGNANLGKLDVALAMDGERIFGNPGLTLFARFIHDTPGALSGDLIGDSQGVSNIEAPRTSRLFELWSEWALASASALRLGLLDFNADFDANETGLLFLNSSHGVGKDLSQSGLAGPSIFPNSALGARVRWSASSNWSMQLAAFDGVPGTAADRDEVDFSLRGNDGAFLATEVDRAGDTLRKLAIGAWHYTGRFTRYSEVTPTEIELTSHGSSGAYALAEFQLHSAPGAEAGGLAAFVRFGVADADVNRFGSYAGTGLVQTGVLTDDDQIGIAVAHAMNGSQYRRSESLAGNQTTRAETSFEVTYRFAVSSHLVVQPDVQYIVHPNTDVTMANALAVGVRFELSGSLD